MDDFSAAHSHDTHWFAIDRDGRVGIFFTGENGHMPSLAGEAESFELVKMARAVIGDGLPGVEDDDIEDWDAFLDALIDFGWYSFNYIDSFGDPEGLVVAYTRDGVPDMPLHVDQLPPEFRSEYRQTCPLSFEEVEQLQPLEFADCYLYYDGDVAYLSSDETVVRPVPGREEEYRKFCERAADWAAQKGVKVEGREEGDGG